MNYSKLVTGLFLGMSFLVNAQNNTTNKKLIAKAEHPNVLVKKVGPNTVIYSYPAKAKQNSSTEQNQEPSIEENIDSFEYPPMRAEQGAILPFHIQLDGEAHVQESVTAQENYYEKLILKPEQNKIIYQDLETTRERLHAAGIYDAQDLYSFDMPLIAKIVGAGILITADITVVNKNESAKVESNIAKAYDTKITFKVFNQNGKVIYSNSHAPYTSTTIDSYQTTLDYIMKQTPFYHKK